MPLFVGKTLSETILKRCHSTPQAKAFSYKRGSGWIDISFQNFYKLAEDFAAGFQPHVTKGERIGVMSNACFERAIAEFSLLGMGKVQVGFDPSMTEQDLGLVVDKFNIDFVVVENAAQLEKFLPFEKVKTLVVLDSLQLSKVSGLGKTVLSFTDLLSQGAEIKDRSFFEKNLLSQNSDDVAFICLTAGTTDVPKGAQLTQGNFVSVLDDCAKVLQNSVISESEKTLTILSPNQVLGKVEYFSTFVFGWQQCFSEGENHFFSNLKEVQPTILFCTPTNIRNAYSAIQEEANSENRIHQKTFKWAVGQASKVSPPQISVVAEKLLSKFLSQSTQRFFGGSLKFAFSGGDPLPEEVSRFFEQQGIPILQGYGLTETAGPITLNTLDQRKIGTVGKPLPEVSLKATDDGEILVKSKKVFHGYFGETPNNFPGGWMPTGDLGFFDSEGYLTLGDRKKDLIFLASGHSVTPQKVESLFKNDPMIQHFVVFGENRDYLAALVTLNREKVIKFAVENHVLYSSYTELVKTPTVRRMVQGIISKINQTLSENETIKRFTILPNEFSVPNSELTPSLKLKRRAIAQKYSKELETLFT